MPLLISITKAQAAMEFLMTYSIGILFVIGILAILAYLGVLSPSKLFPDQCVLPQAFVCKQYKVQSSATTLVISNNLGREISLKSLAVGDCSATVDKTIADGEDAAVELSNCNNGELRERFKADIEIGYVDVLYNIQKTVFGSLAARVE